MLATQTESTVYQSANGSLVGLLATANLTAEDVPSQFANMMGIWITGLCCVMGLIGNAVSLVVLLQAFHKSTMFLVLRAVTASDIVFLVTVLFIMTLVNVYPHTGCLKLLYDHRGYIQFILWPVLMTSQMTTVWLTVFVSIERYIAICSPLKAASICTTSKARGWIFVIVTSATIFNIPRYYEYHYQVEGLVEKTQFSDGILYRYGYAGALYALTLWFIPLTLLALLNIKVIIALKRGRERWKSLHAKQRSEQNLTNIPLAVVIVFVVCATPALAVNVAEATDADFIQTKWFISVLVLSNLMVVLNSATNFIIYCLLGAKFRARLLRMCCPSGSRYNRRQRRRRRCQTATSTILSSARCRNILTQSLSRNAAAAAVVDVGAAAKSTEAGLVDYERVSRIATPL